MPSVTHHAPALEPVRNRPSNVAGAWTVTSALCARSDQPWKFTFNLGGQFVVGETLYIAALQTFAAVAALPLFQWAPPRSNIATA